MEHILIGIVVVAAFAALIWQAHLHRSTLLPLAAQSPASAAQPAAAAPVVINNHLNAPPAPAPAASAPAQPAAQASTWKALVTPAQIELKIPQGAAEAAESVREMAAAALDFAKRGVSVSARLEQFNAKDAVLSAANEAAYRAYWGI